MRKELKILRKELLKKHEWEMLMNKICTKKSEAKFHLGRAVAFSESALLISEILNSENPNSVSNQPSQE